MSIRNTPEILAPCGSYDIMTAAINAGADACYMGGSRFGARAYAQNLNNESYKQAIEYAHLHNTRLYLTVNTLFKDSEIAELYEYLLPYYEAGLDAVIVQDLGAFLCIRKWFPDLHIHCSTQMNITSIHGAKMMKNYGATRIVTAREMSLEEIKSIKKEVDIEIESFVHGAMCYSYSGQCLMSSFAGGRSGNRGRCAQPCRKCYDEQYILSMKDMCTLENIPDFIDAGIDSLKIEGRMKNEYYVASAVDAYKTLANDYVNGCFSKNKALKLKEKLANIYNRGGFCDGYYFMHNGPLMISKKRPNNQGVAVGKLCNINSGQIEIALDRKLFAGDVLELSLTNGDYVEVTSNVAAEKGKKVKLNSPKTKQLVRGQLIYRTRCNEILDGVRQDIIENNKKIAVKGLLKASVGCPMTFTLKGYNLGRCIEVTAYGEIVDVSQKQKADLETIKKKIGQTGETDFEFESLNVAVDENAFVPMSAVKKIRREAIELYISKTNLLFSRNKKDDEISADKKMLDEYNKSFLISEDDIISYDESVNSVNDNLYAIHGIRIHFSNVSQLESLFKVITEKDLMNTKTSISGIYINRRLFDYISEENRAKLKKAEIKIYIELPYIIRNDFDLSCYLPEDSESYDGIYVRNIDGYAAVLNKASNNYKEIIIGASLYAMNNYARHFIGNYIYENSRELTLREYDSLKGRYNEEFTIYGFQQAMLSAQCVIKNTEGCKKNDSEQMYRKITDDKNNIFYSATICEECVNVIYNGVPYSMINKIDDVQKYVAPRYLRINFTLETAKEVYDFIKGIANCNICDKIDLLKSEFLPERIYTTGHCYRGVE